MHWENMLWDKMVKALTGGKFRLANRKPCVLQIFMVGSNLAEGNVEGT